MTLACSLPYHVYGFVDRAFITNRERTGWEPAVWFGCLLPTNRTIGLCVLLECGALYRGLPPHAFAFREDAVARWAAADAQAWDCFGGEAQVLEYGYLRELPVQLIRTEAVGSYLFTLEFANDGFSRSPGQTKCLHGIEIESGAGHGRLTFQPNDRVLVYESSFTTPTALSRGRHTWLRRNHEVYGVETWPSERTHEREHVD